METAAAKKKRPGTINEFAEELERKAREYEIRALAAGNELERRQEMKKARQARKMLAAIRGQQAGRAEVAIENKMRQEIYEKAVYNNGTDNDL